MSTCPIDKGIKMGCNNQQPYFYFCELYVIGVMLIFLYRFNFREILTALCVVFKSLLHTLLSCTLIKNYPLNFQNHQYIMNIQSNNAYNNFQNHLFESILINF